jgi:hypothetical protein
MCQKLQFVTKETKPGIMFQYLLKLLTDFPAHQHRANCQNSQFKTLDTNCHMDAYFRFFGNNLIVSHVGLNIYNFRKNREHKLHDL